MNLIKIFWNKMFRKTKGEVIWFTGLSGSGKTTIADIVSYKLDLAGRKVMILDGDVIRKVFPSTGFSRNQRNEHLKRVGYMASLLEKFDVTVLCTFVSPFHTSRNYVRKMCKNFTLVYVKSSLNACEKRDVKGLYAKARSGKIKKFTGISQAYEPPYKDTIDVEVFTDNETKIESSNKVLKHIL